MGEEVGLRAGDTSEGSRRFEWVGIRAADGRSIAVEQVPGMPVVAGPSGDLFDLVRRDDGKVALFALGAGGFVSATPEWIGAWRGEIGEAELFSVVDAGEGRVAFQLSDGLHYLSAPAGDGASLKASATSIGASESFVIEPFDLSRLPEGGRGCCNAWTRPKEEENEDDPALLWDDDTHEAILKWAGVGMQRPEIQNDETRRFLGFWGRVEFQEQVFQGLDDADYQHPWRGELVIRHPVDPRKSVYTWHNHFYNPTNAKNYMGHRTNAVTEGRRYFNLSVYLGMRMMKLGGAHAPVELLRQAGYYLGLSLHFLTDLTQPMHAANFANVFGEDGGYPFRVIAWDKRHSGFEGYAEMLVRDKGYFADYDVRHPMDHADVATGDVEDANWFLHHTAVNQHRVFEELVLAVARDKERRAQSDWSTEADPALTASLLRAPKTVARYLAYWAKCVNQSWDHIDPGHYYRIVEPTRNEWICLHHAHYMRNTFSNGQDLLFFVFNPDGTWSIGCRSYKRSLWLGYDGLGGHWIGEHRWGGNTPPKESKFRFVPNYAPGGRDGAWIYESGEDQPVIVNEEGFPSQKGYLIRWPNPEPGRELFKLQKMHEIPKGEREEIQREWHDFLRYPWYGQG